MYVGDTMKKRTMIILGVIVALAIIAFVGYNAYRYPGHFRNLKDESLSASQTDKVRQRVLKKENKKILVAYYSYSGTTKDIAESISEKTGADLFEITPKKKYKNVYSQSNSEIRKNARPALLNHIDNMDEYDVVFVGYPIWWHATPSVINTFLESYDLKDKLVIPFCTSAENDISETMPTFLDSCKGLAVYGEKRIASSNEINKWLKDIGLIQSKSLVAYFSWSGNTKKMAEYIAKQTNSDLFEIEASDAYPEDYNETGERAKEERDQNKRPVIKNLPDSIQEYDTLYIGYPIWWHTAPMIIGTYLNHYDLSNVDIYPFTQSASMDTEQFDNSMKFIKENTKGIVHDGLFTDSSNKKEIRAYLKKNTRD